MRSAYHMIWTDLESPDTLLLYNRKIPFWVRKAPAPKIYFDYSSLSIEAGHMIQLYRDRST